MAGKTGQSSRFETEGRRILDKRVRKEAAKGLTQRHLAKMVGTTEKSFWTWRAGTRRPGEIMRDRLFRVLGIDPRTWLTDADREKLRRRIAA